ncbi:hypothetical protein [Psychroflexus sp. ALD_RP9]|uniref:hypothetical protein n=1 Tax=Psychroflexus sp. ALD_RP9 TaxID=2777186 RepID=UPI001A8E836B|nr:hypothetical protein [Psychroflexus sp. ALD_RP9]QSS96264.1 hypothetical protein IMZ30_07290 [Psychroflexus sp. ALD_RP9]
MKPILFLFFILSTCHVSAQRQISIRLINNNQVEVENKKTSIKDLSQVISDFINSQNEDELISANIEVDNTSTDSLIEVVKNEFKKTEVDILNIQRSSITNFSSNSPVTKAMITQYNTLVKTWKNTPEANRYYREIELDFVKNIYKKMTFKQQVNAEKLPGFLPIFNQKPNTKPIEQFKFEQWIFDEGYLVKINGKDISKKELQTYQASDFDAYYIERRIINEEKKSIINLIKS